MHLTKDLLTFTPNPTTEPSDALWQSAIIRKRKQIRTLLEPWNCVDVERLNRLSETAVFVREIPLTLGILSEEEVSITECPPKRLLKVIACGTWSAEAVLRAYIRRAIIAHELVVPVPQAKQTNVLTPSISDKRLL